MTATTETTAPVLSKSAKTAQDVSNLFRARNPLVWIVTREEARVEGFIAEAALAAKYVPHVWDVARGVADIDGTKDKTFEDSDPGAVLDAIRNIADPEPTGKQPKAERGVWIMRDLPAWLQGPGGVTTLRRLRNLARVLPGVPRERGQAIVVLSPSGDIPPELSGHTTVIEWPIPDRAEITAVLDAAVSRLPEFETDPKTNEPDTTKPIRSLAAPAAVREVAIDAAIGLSGEEAAACYARSLVQTLKIVPELVSNEKRRVIARDGLLEWIDPVVGGLEAVGGLEVLKSWVTARKSAYSAEARKYGLPAPKGAFVVGVSGCGKSLFAKATATAWSVPLLKLDLGALKSKFVGESEAKIRKAFGVIAAIGRCVVWIDEIEKSLQGATSGSADGGVSSDALGVLLTWMQERTSEAFVIATANDVSNLPPELLRKGRFDELWFVDLPNDEERVAVLRAALKAHGRQGVKIGLRTVADACRDFTGSEIAAIVPDALFAAFAEDAREITTADLIAAAATVTPLSQTAKEKVAALRDWALNRARPATAKATGTAAKAKAAAGFDIG